MPWYARAARSSLATQVWLITLIGVLLGAGIGIAWHFADSGVMASALVRIDQPIDPDEIIIGNYSPSADMQQGYISGEIAYLTSSGFAGTVAKELNQTDTPKLSATQNARSSVITVSATAATFHDAERTVNAAIKAYADHVQEQNRERCQAAIDSIKRVIDLLSTDSERNATRIGQLEAQRTSIEVQAQRPAGVQVVQPPIQTPRAYSSITFGAIAGGVFGGLVALAAALGWRRYRGEQTSVAGPAASG